MSIDAMNAVFSRTDLPPYERLVMLALADRCDDDMTCFPSIADICQRTGMGERGVQNVINRLEVSGFLVVKRGGGRHVRNGYLLIVPAKYPASETPYADTLPRTRNPVSNSNTPHVVTETPHPVTKNPAPGAHEPSKNHQRTQSKSKARDALLLVLSPSAADAYIAHRSAKRAKLTEHAAELIAKKLVGHPDPDGVVNESIANGWTGVFPEKTRPPDKPKTNLDAAFSQFLGGQQ